MASSVTDPEARLAVSLAPARLRDVAAVAMFLAALGVMCWRLYEHRPSDGPADKDLWALASYRDAVYYPCHAVRDGVNPYDTTRGDPQRFLQRYPVGDALPLYSPLVMMLFAPLTVLPIGASMVAYSALTVALFFLLAKVTLRLIGAAPQPARVFGLATFLLISQPGRGLFFAGQFALPLALAAAGALEWGDRRGWLSGWLVALTTYKPTFGGPLGLLLVARRDWRSALIGFVIGGALAAAGMLLIFARSGDLSWAGVKRVIVQNQSDFYEDPTVLPQNNKGRIDLAATFEYLTNRPTPTWIHPALALGVLGATALALWRGAAAAGAPSAISSTGALIVLAMYVCVYHNVYDLPLLVIPIAAAATQAHPSWRRMTSFERWWLVGLMLTPFLSFLWTEGFRNQLNRLGVAFSEEGGAVSRVLFRLCCAANGLALLAAWLTLLIRACGRRPQSRPAPLPEGANF